MQNEMYKSFIFLQRHSSLQNIKNKPQKQAESPH